MPNVTGNSNHARQVLLRKVSAVVFSLADTLDWPLKSVWNSNLLLLMSKVAAGASPPRQIWFDCFEPTTSEMKRVTTRMDCMLFIAETWIFVAIYCIKPGKRVLFAAKVAEIQDLYQVCLVCDSDCCELKMESPA